LKNDSWFHLNEYVVVVNEGTNVTFDTFLVLMMEDMELMFSANNATSLSFFQLQLSINMAILGKL
jgi:hypothetical protein